MKRSGKRLDSIFLQWARAKFVNTGFPLPRISANRGTTNNASLAAEERAMPATFDIAASSIAGMARSYVPAGTTRQERDFHINCMRVMKWHFLQQTPIVRTYQEMRQISCQLPTLVKKALSISHNILFL